MTVEARFRAGWNAVADQLSLMPELRAYAEAYLMTQYGGVNRHYHNLTHIVAMLDQAQKIEWHDPLAVRLAIFFHDVIYDPARSDNEAQSAVKLHEWLEGQVTAEILGKASAMIEATRYHAGTGDFDTDHLLDIDMGILGQSWPIYQTYAEGVRREYVPVYGEAAYDQGRLNLFLEPVLARDRIFLTETFRHLDGPAQRNLKAERKALIARLGIQSGNPPHG